MNAFLKHELKLASEWIVASLILIAAISLLCSCSRHVTKQKPASEPDQDAIRPDPAARVTPGPSVTPTAPAPKAEITQATISPIYFDYDRSHLRPDQIPAIEAMVSGLKGAHTVTIAGHCDERGTIEYNLALGLRRAETVRVNLARLGVKGTITTVSYVKERPDDPGHDETAWAKNRRVEAKVESK